ncbi:MAG: translation initiation factor IF-2 [Proteobacteria bacterium]|nr:translation initiation factor IF-2 [Pseudomonadota bacterium]
MTDTHDKSSESGKTLTLSGVVGSKKMPQQVRQSFQQGRSKTVTVEVKKKRLLQKDTPDVSLEKENLKGEGLSLNQKPIDKESKETSSKTLTVGEIEARFQALKGSFRSETVKEPEKNEKETGLALPEHALEVKAETLSPESLEDEKEPISSQPSEEKENVPVSKHLSFRDRAAGFIQPQETSENTSKANVLEKEVDLKKKVHAKRLDISEEEGDEGNKKGKKKVLNMTPRREGSHRSSRFDLFSIENEDEDSGEEETSTRRKVALPRRMRPFARVQKNPSEKKEHQKVIRDVIIPEVITVQELANRMAVRGAEVVKSLMKMGMMVSINQVIDADTAELVVAEFGHTLKRVSDADIETGLGAQEDAQHELVARPPVVTIMGHVDHGKTSLLDALRLTDVVSREAGGITQHIGAYQVTLQSHKKITFIDTPGHAAFTEMRARGAHVTDIVVLVVAADDGIKDQTIEALNHVKAAGVPLLIAVNKIDKPEANPTRVREELLQHGVVLEEFGGDVLSVDVSAKNKINLDKLEEAILLQAELLELKANPNRQAEGVVIEAKLEKGQGPVATILINRGTLKMGDVFVSGSHWGRVRTLINDHGQKVTQALPSTPIEVVGFNSVPLAGDKFFVVENEEKAREIAEFRLHRDKAAENLNLLKTQTSMDEFFSQMKEGLARELPILLKADVQGSLEAIKASLEKLSTREVSVKLVHSGVGGIHESDIILAKASGAFVIGFNVRANPQARDLAHKEKIEIRYYSIIYNVLDDVKKALGGLLSPDLRENFLGYAEIREIFNVSKTGPVAGCIVTEGIVKRGAKVRLLRDDIVIHEGVLKTLRRFKEEVKEVREGFECGMAFENYQDIRKGDRIECFEIEEIARTL